MKDFQRWYDRIPKVKEVFMVFRNMSDRELDQCSRVLYGVIVEYRRRNRNSKELNTLGPEKVKGYYKAFQQRRWYDKNPNMRNSARFLSIMEPMEAETIINDFMYNLKNEGLGKIYNKNKTDL